MCLLTKLSCQQAVNSDCSVNSLALSRYWRILFQVGVIPQISIQTQVNKWGFFVASR